MPSKQFGNTAMSYGQLKGQGRMYNVIRDAILSALCGEKVLEVA